MALITVLWTTINSQVKKPRDSLSDSSYGQSVVDPGCQPDNVDPEFSFHPLPHMAPSEQTGAVIITTTASHIHRWRCNLLVQTLQNQRHWWSTHCIQNTVSGIAQQLLIYLWRQDRICSLLVRCAKEEGVEERRGREKKSLALLSYNLSHLVLKLSSC